MTQPNWDEVQTLVAEHLRAMLRLKTVNPPGDEILVARYLDGVCRAAGIETELLEPVPGKAVFRARLRGTGSSGRALLLVAHMDTVPVEVEHWTTDPFGGEERNGYIYGRGAIDDKGMLAVHLVALLLLKRHVVDAGHALPRDVVLLATSDEETGGDYGIEWIANNRPDFLDADDALNEGGRIRVADGRPLYAAIQCAEKVSHVVTLTAKGPPGHASVPIERNALWAAGRVLTALSRHREPLTLIPTTRDFFAALATMWPDEIERRAFDDLVSSDASRVRAGETRLATLPALDALARAGISATIVHGGERANVIPSEVTITLNVRTLPGQPLDDVIQRLRGLLRDEPVDIVVTSEGASAPVTTHGAGVYSALAEIVRELEPNITVMPYLSTGATDSARLRRHGIRAFGILPFPLLPDDEARMHGHDERVPRSALLFGVKLLYGTVLRS